MNPKEQEIAIGELEERVDRLRNIYEQYFLGFEKLEPTVPRKDVDRRLAILRKEQIRNTAMRFRFQVVTQKYNTYAMHWIRICRQIEEGTYKRHIRKAKARFGDNPQSPEREISIDIDLDDFEVDMDMDSDASDTVRPPGPPVLDTPHTSFAIAGHREVLDELEPNTPPPSMRLPERAARGAALPAGSKPRLLRKRDDNDPPASHPTMPGAQSSQRLVPEPPPSQKGLPGGPPSHRTLPGAPHSSPQLRPFNPASTVRGPAPSSPGFENTPGARPSGPRIAPAAAHGPPPAGSAGRMSAATPSAGAPAAGRIPIAAAHPPSAGAQSSARTPISPFAPVGPNPGARGAPGAPSAGRVPVPPPSAPSTGRMPVAPPARAGAPPGSRPNPPHADPAAASPRPAGPNPAPRPPMPSVSDSSPPSGAGRPSARPRMPLPLPSQLTRPPPPKKE